MNKRELVYRISYNTLYYSSWIFTIPLMLITLQPFIAQIIFFHPIVTNGDFIVAVESASITGLMQIIVVLGVYTHDKQLEREILLTPGMEDGVRP